MKAKLKVLDALQAVAFQLSRSPDLELREAANDELTDLSKRRAKLLKELRRDEDAQPEFSWPRTSRKEAAVGVL